MTAVTSRGYQWEHQRQVGRPPPAQIHLAASCHGPGPIGPGDDSASVAFAALQVGPNRLRGALREVPKQLPAATEGRSQQSRDGHRHMAVRHRLQHPLPGDSVDRGGGSAQAKRHGDERPSARRVATETRTRRASRALPQQIYQRQTSSGERQPDTDRSLRPGSH